MNDEQKASILVKCCCCRRMKTPLGWRRQFAPASNSDEMVSHGLCPECFAEATAQMDIYLNAAELQMAR